MNYFSRNLKYLRTSFGLKQEDMAGIVNKLRGTIGNWESGLSEPNINELILLSKFFDIRLDILVLTPIEKKDLITEAHIAEFDKKGKLKTHTVEYDTTIIETEVAEPEEPSLLEIIDEIKQVNNNVSRLRNEVKKSFK